MLLAACGGASAPTRANWVTLEVAQGKEQILDLRTGKAVSFEAMVADLATARVVYVGERHDNADDHAIEYAVLDALLHRPGSLALGLEMFQYPYQPVLDAWSAQKISEAQFLKRTDYEARWGHDYDFYRPILEAARDAGARLIALNAPTEVTRAVAHGGLQALDPDQLADLPNLKLDDARHRKLVTEGIDGHGLMEADAFERYYAAQVVWDETMGLHIAEALNSAGEPDRLLVLAGRLHVEEGLGIPSRAARRGAKPWKVVLPVDANDKVLSWHGPADERPADYLWVIPLQRSN